MHIPVTADQLAFHDDDMKLRVVPGDYVVFCGGDSYAAGSLSATVTIPE